MKIKVLLFGGTGTLGKELLKKFDPDKFEVYAPNRNEINLHSMNVWLGSEKIVGFKPDIIIYSAGLINTEKCEELPNEAIQENITSVTELVRLCSIYLIETKFIYISSEYVFGEDGKGFYLPDDRLNPMNVYGKTKAAAEYIVSILPNHQIIRVPFFKKFHPEAYTDQYVSRLTVDEAAKNIIDVIFTKDKIIHISGDRDSIYDHYKKLGIEAKPIETPDNLKKIIPRDTSLVDIRNIFKNED